MDADKMHCKKARWELHKNTMSYIKQFLEATLHETATVKPLTYHLLNHLSKTNKTCSTRLTAGEAR